MSPRVGGNTTTEKSGRVVALGQLRFGAVVKGGSWTAALQEAGTIWPYEERFLSLHIMAILKLRRHSTVENSLNIHHVSVRVRMMGKGFGNVKSISGFCRLQPAALRIPMQCISMQRVPKKLARLSDSLDIRRFEAISHETRVGHQPLASISKDTKGFTTRQGYARID